MLRRDLDARPTCDNAINFRAHRFTRNQPLNALHQQLIITGMAVPNVSYHRQFDSPSRQLPAGRLTSHASTAAGGGMFREPSRLFRRAAGILLQNRLHERLDKLRSSRVRTSAARARPAARLESSAAHSFSALAKPSDVTSNPWRS